mmetsp:Transcript_142885/g.456432  ORF Transcript_142885/g.456432 Transcript_142885/m.456432 type:complete len:659 (-) Transcript_142885:69-2045(-)
MALRKVWADLIERLRGGEGERTSSYNNLMIAPGPEALLESGGGSSSGLPQGSLATPRIHRRRSPGASYPAPGRLDRFVLDPRTSAIRGCWDTTIWCILLIVAFWTPYECAFGCRDGPGSPFWARIVDSAVDVVFVIDMVMTFLTAYPDGVREGMMEKRPARIAWRYLTSWFLADSLSMLPGVLELWHGLNAYLYKGPSEAEIQTMRLMRVVRLARLMRLNHFFYIARKWQLVSGTSYSKLSLVNFFSIIVLCCHWMACLWGGVAAQSSLNQRTWIHALRENKGGDDIQYEDPWSIYSMSLYWAIMTITSIGYGDILPQSEHEYWIASLCMVVMAGIWAYIIGQVCGVVSTLMPHDVAFKRTMDDLNWLMEDRKVSSEKRLELRRYFHESRDLRRLSDQKVIIDQMSPMLQGQVTSSLLNTWQNKVSYIRDMDKDVLVRVIRQLRPMLFAPKEAILSERTLFIVRRGICLRGGKVLASGDVWGVDMVLSNDHLRDMSTARCLCYMETLCLRYADLMYAVEPFHKERARIRWAEVKLACCRALQLINVAVRALHKLSGKSLHDLSETQRIFLYQTAINGTFEGHVPADDNVCEARAGTFQRSLGQRSISEDAKSAHGTERSDSPDLNEVLYLVKQQCADIHDLKASLAEMRVAMASTKRQ